MKFISTFWSFRTIRILIRGKSKWLSNRTLFHNCKSFDCNTAARNQACSYGENEFEDGEQSKELEHLDCLGYQKSEARNKENDFSLCFSGKSLKGSIETLPDYIKPLVTEKYEFDYGDEEKL